MPSPLQRHGVHNENLSVILSLNPMLSIPKREFCKGTFATQKNIKLCPTTPCPLPLPPHGPGMGESLALCLVICHNSTLWSPRSLCLDFGKALSSFRVKVHHNCCLADNY